MSNYHIYYTGQLAGAPLATIPAASARDAIAAFRRERPDAIRADRLVAETKLRTDRNG